MEIALPLLGGVGLFLLGMSLMTDGLKLAGGEALRSILANWTKTRLRGLAAGALITAIVQSSSAVTIATIGFVNAGLLTLTQAIWVLFGANVGTTMTSWLVALVGFKLDVAALALPFVGVGMLTRLFARDRQRLAGLGQTLAGFGAFFLGIDVLRDAFVNLVPQIATSDLDNSAAFAPVIFVALGALLTVLTQSSSAAVAIALAANAGAGVSIELTAGAVIGANIGTTSTALLAAIGATPAAKRVAGAHIAFNVFAALAALLVLSPLLAASIAIADNIGAAGDETIALAVFHTLFNCLGVILIWPLAPHLVRRLNAMFASPQAGTGRASHLDATLAEVPSLALRGLVIETENMRDRAFTLARQRVDGLHTPTDGAQYSELLLFGQAIRDFIAQLSRRPLPEEVVLALPDIIRAVHHFEDMGAISALLTKEAQPALGIWTQPHWRRLGENVTAALADAPGIDVERHRNDLEGAYQEVKQHLLIEAAGGRLAVYDMEALLLHARRLRRIGEAALKARRRLEPWSPLARDVITSLSVS